jgi:hypothetical protein
MKAKRADLFVFAVGVVRKWTRDRAKYLRVIGTGAFAGAYDRTGLRDRMRPRVLQRIMREAERDKRLDELIGQENWTLGDLERAYVRLVAAGGRRWVGLHYLPVSVFSYAGSFRYYAENQNAPWETLEETVVPQLILLFKKMSPRSFSV